MMVYEKEGHHNQTNAYAQQTLLETRRSKGEDGEVTYHLISITTL